MAKEKAKKEEKKAEVQKPAPRQKNVVEVTKKADAVLFAELFGRIDALEHRINLYAAKGYQI